MQLHNIQHIKSFLNYAVAYCEDDILAVFILIYDVCESDHPSVLWPEENSAY